MINSQQQPNSVMCNNHLQSYSRLIQSQYLTIQMAVHYLFTCRQNLNLINILLNRLSAFDRKQLSNYLPTIMYILCPHRFIMSLKPYKQYLMFIQNLSHQSLAMYLIIRWSYATFWSTSTKVYYENQLDTSILKQHHLSPNQEQFQQLKDHEKNMIVDKVKMKFIISQYTSNVHQFYQRLFKIPYKLKKYQKNQRKNKLIQYLTKIQTNFQSNNNSHYQKGVILPISHPSNIIVRIVINYCVPFSTKQRVPFKVVFETVSQDEQYLPNIQQEAKKNQPMILPHTYFGEQWNITMDKIRESSPFGKQDSYKIRTYMVKSGDDLRQQYLAMQLIKIISNIIKKQNLKLWVKTYDVIPYDHQSGLIEFVDDTRTVSYLKQMSGQKSLKNIYHQLFINNFQKAMLNFVQSLAGYSLIQYLLKIKDRHNNNIMIDREGHIIHIDFSFMISSTPGNMNFQKAPFKLVQDYIDIMEGPQSDLFQHFQLLFFLGLKYIRKYKKQIMDTINIMIRNHNMKCFVKFNPTQMMNRFHENSTDQELQQITKNIVNEAWSSYTTNGYDRFQWFTNSIHS